MRDAEGEVVAGIEQACIAGITHAALLCLHACGGRQQLHQAAGVGMRARIRGPGAFGADQGRDPGGIELVLLRITQDLALVWQGEAQGVVAQVLAGVESEGTALVPAGGIGQRNGGAAFVIGQGAAQCLPFAPRPRDATDGVQLHRANEAGVGLHATFRGGAVGLQRAERVGSGDAVGGEEAEIGRLAGQCREKFACLGVVGAFAQACLEIAPARIGALFGGHLRDRGQCGTVVATCKGFAHMPLMQACIPGFVRHDGEALRAFGQV